ncbi:hypothetical protein ACFX15_039542 [Malus domestica]
MNKHGVPLPYVAASLCDYTRKWISSSSGEEDKMNHQREILEAVERLLPRDIDYFHAHYSPFHYSLGRKRAVTVEMG